MSMGMRMSLNLRQVIRLSQEQKIKLGLLLSLRQTLRAPAPPEVVKGLEGIQSAQNILRQRKACGVLIGGIAEAVWNRQRTAEELGAHKDVDVMVMREIIGLENKFEGGVDWWLPRTERIQIRTDVSSSDNDFTWWQNGNGVRLNFGIRQKQNLPPGLYIPSPEWVTLMRLSEVSAQIGGGVDYDVEEAFKKRVKKNMTNTIMPDLHRDFKQYILASRYGGDERAITINDFTLDEIAAVRRHSEGASGTE